MVGKLKMNFKDKAEVIGIAFAITLSGIGLWQNHYLARRTSAIEEQSRKNTARMEGIKAFPEVAFSSRDYIAKTSADGTLSFENSMAPTITNICNQPIEEIIARWLPSETSGFIDALVDVSPYTVLPGEQAKILSLPKWANSLLDRKQERLYGYLQLSGRAKDNTTLKMKFSFEMESVSDNELRVSFYRALEGKIGEGPIW